MTFSRTSPLIHKRLFYESFLNSASFFVNCTYFSSISRQSIWPSAEQDAANSDAPFPKVSSYPINAAVSALSPVIILTWWELFYNSYITPLVQGFRGHSATMKPQKIKSHSACSLV